MPVSLGAPRNSGVKIGVIARLLDRVGADLAQPARDFDRGLPAAQLDILRHGSIDSHYACCTTTSPVRNSSAYSLKAEGAEGHCEGMAPTVFWDAAYDWLDTALNRAD
jgi:hypothetical protein